MRNNELSKQILKEAQERFKNMKVEFEIIAPVFAEEKMDGDNVLVLVEKDYVLVLILHNFSLPLSYAKRIISFFQGDGFGHPPFCWSVRVKSSYLLMASYVPFSFRFKSITAIR